TGMPDGRAESAVRNHARRIFERRVGIHRIAKGTLRKNTGEVQVEGSAAGQGQAGRIRSQRVDHSSLGWKVHTSEGHGTGAGGVPIKTLGVNDGGHAGS